MSLIEYSYGGKDPAQVGIGLAKDLARLEKHVGNLDQPKFVTKAITTAETSTLVAKLTYWTAGGTIAAQTAELPAAPKDQQEHTLLCSQAVTELIVSVASGGDATVVAAPTALVADVPVSLRYDATQNKWYRVG